MDFFHHEEQKKHENTKDNQNQNESKPIKVHPDKSLNAEQNHQKNDNAHLPKNLEENKNLTAKKSNEINLHKKGSEGNIIHTTKVPHEKLKETHSLNSLNSLNVKHETNAINHSEIHNDAHNHLNAPGENKDMPKEEEKDQKNQPLWNFQKSSDSNLTSNQPLVFAKNFNKRCDKEYEFRQLISIYENCSGEIAYLYQNDKQKEKITEQIIELQKTFNTILEKLIQANDHQEKINIITNFYIHNDLHHIQELIIKNLYHPIHQISKEMHGVDLKAYFQDFEPFLNKTEVSFDKIKYIKPPKNYDRKLNPEMIDKYDKFVSIVNILISIQKLIEFKDKFDQQNKLLAVEEKKLIEDEIRKDEAERIKREKEQLQEEKERIQREEQLLLEDEKRRDEMTLKNFDQKIKEKKQILSKLKESISTLTTQLSVFEKKRQDLESHFKSVEKERIQVEKELSDNYNDMIKCLKDTHENEKNIQLMLLHDGGNNKHHSSQKLKTKSDYSLDSFLFIEMSKEEKLAYFNELVNKKTDDKYDIQVKDFCTLTENIKIVTEQQFEYMINYYNHKHSKGDTDCKFIFQSLEIIPISMVQRIYDLKDFSVKYLSEAVLKKLVHRSLLCDKLIGTLEKILFVNDKTEGEQEKLIKKCKKDYYSICSSTSNEVFVYKDTKIIESLFFNGYNIEKVVIPDSVVEIQDNAFYECKNLKTVVLNCKKLKAIGKSAFSGCVNLENFTIPDKIKVIHKCTFLGCQNLSKIVLPAGLEQIKGKAFSGCKSLTKIKMPKSVSKIGKGCFEKCSSLKVFLIPGVIAIYPNGEDPPKGINDETTIQNFKIAAKCFSKCNEIQNVIMTKKCNLIDQFCFSSCSKLENVTYSLSHGSKIDIYSFTECPQLKNVIFNFNKNSSLELSDSSFLNCKQLVEVTFNHQDLLAKDALIIDSNVFNGCEKLQKFVFPENSKKDIGESCFEGCKSLTTVTLPKGMTCISKSLFKNCELLSSVNLDPAITTIESSAFENCQKLQLEKLPQNLVKICDNAFAKCISLNIHLLPEKLEDIGESSFDGCTNLTEIIFPTCMKIINEKAFEGCSELTKITIYSQSIKILKKAFYKCTKLKKIYTNNKTDISSEAFKNCAKGLDFFSLDS